MQALALLLHYPGSTGTATTRVADPDPCTRIRIHVDKDPDPAHHKSDENLRPLIYRTYKALFLASNLPEILPGSILSL